MLYDPYGAEFENNESYISTQISPTSSYLYRPGTYPPENLRSSHCSFFVYHSPYSLTYLFSKTRNSPLCEID